MRLNIMFRNSCFLFYIDLYHHYGLHLMKNWLNMLPKLTSIKTKMIANLQSQGNNQSPHQYCENEFHFTPVSKKKK